MSFDWTEFLNLAEALLNSPEVLGSREASLRSAVSRAYYAAHKSALNREASSGAYSPYGGGSDHMGLIKHFQKSTSRSKKAVGITLDRLRTNRAKADYDNVLRGDPARMARSSIKKAREILDAINAQ